MVTETELAVFQAASAGGCCKRCALRFIADTADTFDQYKDPDNTIANFGHSDIPLEPPPAKQHKPSTASCTVCLGLLQDALLDEMLAHHALMDLEQYEVPDCVLCVSFPPCILLRQRSMHIYLAGKFPGFYDDHTISPLNKTWRHSIIDQFTRITNKTQNPASKLTVDFHTTYSLNDEEVAVMHQIHKELLNNSCSGPKKKKKKITTLSKLKITDLLVQLDDDTFRRYFRVPPQRVTMESLTLDGVVPFAQPIIAAGLYLKYSRFLFQFSGETSTSTMSQIEHSVKSIILKGVRDVLRCKEQIEWKVNGYEDHNVRVLGTGRPFYIEITNPKMRKITFRQFRDIEMEIKKSNTIEVKNFQRITRPQVQKLLNGELNPKTYSAVCRIIKSEDTTSKIRLLQSAIDVINSTTSKTAVLEVFQRTPTKRMVNRRDVAKKKSIYSLIATKVEGKDNCFQIQIRADCGFYIPEFINGDEGRTTPSLGDLINVSNDRIELVELDVIDIFSFLTSSTAKDEEVEGSRSDM